MGKSFFCRSSLGCGAMLAAWLAALPAGAQEMPDEVVVVARKKAENLQEVPLAVTALTEEQLERLNIKDVADVVQQDPSVQFDQGFTPSDTRITIRGLSPTRGRPNVATLVDGVDISSEAISNAGGSLLINPRLIIVDARQIEVVKGPQSALYGRNAFAGAVQYVTKDPSETLTSEWSVEGAEGGAGYLTGVVSGPLTDTLGYRVSGLAWTEDGFYRNELTGGRVGGGEGAGVGLTLRWDVSDTLSFKLRTDYSDDEFAAPAQANVPLNSVLETPANASECFVDANGLTGFLKDPRAEADCAARAGTGSGTGAFALDSYFAAPGAGPLGLGSYDPVANAYQFNDMRVLAFTGKIPDADQLSIRLSPNTRDGCVANCGDYEGITREVFRSQLVGEWELDAVTLTSLSAFASADSSTALDIDKNALPNDGSDPTCVYQDCSSIGFFQNSSNSLKMFSQELRAGFSPTETLQLNAGIYYWHEKINNFDKNNTFTMAGPLCTLIENDTGGFDDISLDPGLSAFFGFAPEQYECGRTSTPIAPWVDDGFRAHPGTRISRKTEHVSFYGQVDWQLTDAWNLNLEARYVDEDNTVTGPSMRPCWYDPDAAVQDPMAPCDPNGPQDPPAVLGPGSLPLCGSGGRCDTAISNGQFWWDRGFAPLPSVQDSFSRSDSYWTPKATLRFTPNDVAMFYGSWSVAKKPGGFSLVTVGAFGVDANLDGNPDEISFEPEKMVAWELGTKTTWLDGRLRVNGAVFFQDYTDKQVSLQSIIGDQLGTVIDNAAAAEVPGAELEVVWQATDNLTVMTSYTYLDGKYKDFAPTSNSSTEIAKTGSCELIQIQGNTTCVVDRSGNAIERSPDNAVVANINYMAPLLNTGLEWYSEVNFRYQDERFVEDFERIVLPTHSITDLRLGVQAERWDAQFYVLNLFDNDTILSAGTGPGIPDSDFRFGFVAQRPFAISVAAAPKIPTSVYANMPRPRQLGIRVAYRFGE